MKLFILNSSINTGSTGKIAEQIGVMAMDNGYTVRGAFGQRIYNSNLNLVRVGNTFDFLSHGLKSYFFDAQGLGSKSATELLVNELDKWNPDIVNIHNLHGYYIHIETLFKYLRRRNIYIIWTFHDCWPFTGHCTHFEKFQCEKWMIKCFKCPNRLGYPTSLFLDRSNRNFALKKSLFTNLNNLIIVTPSYWMASLVKKSFFSSNEIKIIHNGIDLEIFKPYYQFDDIRKSWGLSNKKIILGVANTWKKRRALQDFIDLSKLINDDYLIVLVGLNQRQSKGLPSNILGIPRLENQSDLAKIYSLATIFMNPTYADNFPTANLESLACGTPVATYSTGGSSETIDSNTGFLISRGDIKGLYDTITTLENCNYQEISLKCRERAKSMFDKKIMLVNYLDLFKDLSS